MGSLITSDGRSKPETGKKKSSYRSEHIGRQFIPNVWYGQAEKYSVCNKIAVDESCALEAAFDVLCV